VLVDPPPVSAVELEPLLTLLRERVAGGVRLVIVGDLELGIAEPARLFDVPALDLNAARRLLRRAMPSLTDAMVHQVLEATGARPGVMRRLVARAGSRPLASSKDLEH